MALWIFIDFKSDSISKETSIDCSIGSMFKSGRYEKGLKFNLKCISLEQFRILSGIKVSWFWETSRTRNRFKLPIDDGKYSNLFTDTSNTSISVKLPMDSLLNWFWWTCSSKRFERFPIDDGNIFTLLFSTFCICSFCTRTWKFWAFWWVDNVDFSSNGFNFCWRALHFVSQTPLYVSFNSCHSKRNFDFLRLSF